MLLLSLHYEHFLEISVRVALALEKAPQDKPYFGVECRTTATGIQWASMILVASTV
jgi:hypothetical protein